MYIGELFSQHSQAIPCQHVLMPSDVCTQARARVHVCVCQGERRSREGLGAPPPTTSRGRVQPRRRVVPTTGCDPSLATAWAVCWTFPGSGRGRPYSSMTVWRPEFHRQQCPHTAHNSPVSSSTLQKEGQRSAPRIYAEGIDECGQAAIWPRWVLCWLQ